MYEYRKLTQEGRLRIVEERLARGFPPHSPPQRSSEPGQYLLTAVCYEHRHHMRAAARRKQIVDELLSALTLQGIEIRAWVVLPNHYHLLLYSPGGRRFGQVLRPVHGRTAFQWNRDEQASGRKVWYRHSDRAMRSERHFFTTLNYIHFNPVKHGYVRSPYEWQESSVHWYLASHGRQWLRDVWREHPVRDYGKEWDDL